MDERACGCGEPDPEVEGRRAGATVEVHATM